MEPVYTDPSEIITTWQETAQGFLQQATRQFELALPFVEGIIEAKRKLEEAGEELESLLDAAESDDELFEILIAASGFSEKAKSAIGTDETKQLLRQHIIGRKGDLSKEDLIETILYRYALTCGDQLGGVKRNDTGRQAEIKLGEYLLKKMQTKYKSVGVRYLQRRRNTFGNLSGTDIPILLENGLSAIQWPQRVLAFNMKCPFIGTRGNNIDIILLETSEQLYTRGQLVGLLKRRENYILCGELKGGIDPAGADEHWKTASRALDRIEESFPDDTPKLVFVGAAIEATMAHEIIERLEKGRLAGVANLCKPEQMERLVDWLVEL